MVFDLFSIPVSESGMRTRIVVAISDMEGNLEWLEESQVPTDSVREILHGKEAFIESVTVLARNGAWVFEGASLTTKQGI